MGTNLNKFLMVGIYVGIIILIPIFLDYLFRLTVRRKRKLNIMYQAEKKSRETKKPILIFNNRYGGIINNMQIDPSGKKEVFESDITQILSQLKENSFVLVVSETLEYVDNVEETIKQMQSVSGGDMYIVGIEKNSPRVWFDYKIRNVFDNPFYLPTDHQIKWVSPNDLQKKVQGFYSYGFKILPYNFFTTDPIDRI